MFQDFSSYRQGIIRGFSSSCRGIRGEIHSLRFFSKYFAKNDAIFTLIRFLAYWYVRILSNVLKFCLFKGAIFWNFTLRLCL